MIKIVIFAAAAITMHAASCDPQSIVGEVAKLRQKYEECRQGQSIVQGVDPKLYRDSQVEKRALLIEAKEQRKRIEALERELAALKSKNALLEKQLVHKSQIPPVKPLSSHTSAVTAPLGHRITAPSVAMKPLDGKPHSNEKRADSKVSTAVSAQKSTSKKGSSAYRMNTESAIYDSPNGTIVEKWEAQRSFTAGEPSNGWIRITGYFVNRVWQSAGANESLWVKEGDVIRR